GALRPEPPPANVREQEKTNPGAEPGPGEPVLASMGVDAGDHAHFAVVERRGLAPHRLVHAAVVDSHGMVAHAARLRQGLGVQAAVVDAKPLRVEARDIAAQAPGSTWLLDFSASEGPREKEGRHEDLRFKRVVMGREEMIDALVDLLIMSPPGILLPRATAGSEETLRLVRLHLRNLKQEAVKTVTGVRQRYRRDVENHFGFALAMAVLAGSMTRKAARWVPLRALGRPHAAAAGRPAAEDNFIPMGTLRWRGLFR
ncbi:MAG: hypothetical protein AAB368_02690, partial [bacterium]